MPVRNPVRKLSANTERALRILPVLRSVNQYRQSMPPEKLRGVSGQKRRWNVTPAQAGQTIPTG